MDDARALAGRLLDVTVRDGDDAWHLECRFADGQKFAAVQVDKDAPGAESIAHSIANMLIVGRDAIDPPAAPAGVGLTRYDLTASYSELSVYAFHKIEPSEGGDWVRHEDAAAALAAWQSRAAERCNEAEKWFRQMGAERERADTAEADRDALKAALAGLEAANEEVKDATTREIERQRDEATALVERLRKGLKDCIEDYEDAANYKDEYLRNKHGDAENIAKYRALLSEPQASEGREPANG